MATKVIKRSSGLVGLGESIQGIAGKAKTKRRKTITSNWAVPPAAKKPNPVKSPTVTRIPQRAPVLPKRPRKP